MYAHAITKTGYDSLVTMMVCKPTNGPTASEKAPCNNVWDILERRTKGQSERNAENPAHDARSWIISLYHLSQVLVEFGTSDISQFSAHKTPATLYTCGLDTFEILQSLTRTVPGSLSRITGMYIQSGYERGEMNLL